MYFLSLLSALCSVRFLISFANVLFISIGYRLLLDVSLGPQLFFLPLLWVESGLVPTLSLSSVHAFLKDVHVHLTVPVYTLIGCVFFSLSVSAVQETTASLNTDVINI